LKREWYKSGELKEAIGYLNDKKDGVKVEYANNGSLESKTEKKLGEKKGKEQER